jgi:hypothetical protein
MAIRRFSNSSITSAGGKSSKLWDQETSLGTFESIATAVITSAQTTITFSNIPQGYSHLQIRSVIFGTGLYGQFLLGNSSLDTGANYSHHVFSGEGTTFNSYNSSSATQTRFFGSWSDPGSALAPQMQIIDILDYSSTTKYKTIRSFFGSDGNGAGEVGLYSGSWQSTNPVTTLQLRAGNSTFDAYSIAALYGIRGA